MGSYYLWSYTAAADKDKGVLCTVSILTSSLVNMK